MSDFNVHIDNVCEKNTNEHAAIDDTFDLSQHVREPTHRKRTHSGFIHD